MRKGKTIFAVLLLFCIFFAISFGLLSLQSLLLLFSRNNDPPFSYYLLLIGLLLVATVVYKKIKINSTHVPLGNEIQGGHVSQQIESQKTPSRPSRFSFRLTAAVYVVIWILSLLLLLKGCGHWGIDSPPRSPICMSAVFFNTILTFLLVLFIPLLLIFRENRNISKIIIYLFLIILMIAFFWFMSSNY